MKKQSDPPEIGELIYKIGVITHIADGCAWVGHRPIQLFDIVRLETGVLVLNEDTTT
jgi:hypothetical protein